MLSIRNFTESVLHLLFPHVCPGCGSDLLNLKNPLCLRCTQALPETGYERFPDNPVEKLFRGRLPVTRASSAFYFTKQSLMQQVMHEMKYRANRDLGLFLGRLMGDRLRRSARFSDIDGLVPLPLHADRELKRGFNQAALLCEGISAVTGIPVFDRVIIRTEATDTQTRKGRIERWKNISGKFELIDRSGVRGTHLLLVDDVVTTGATLESCGTALLQVDALELSIATLCYSSG